MRKRTITILLSLIMITAGTTLFAQHGRGLGPCGMGNGRDFGQFEMGSVMMWSGHFSFLNLTDKQKEQIKELKTKHNEEIQQLREKMKELAIEHRDLMNAEKLDKEAINASIDEKTELMNKLMKKQVEFHIEFLSLLTDEQKEKLDNSGKRFGVKKGMKNTGRRGRGFHGRGFHGGGFHRW